MSLQQTNSYTSYFKKNKSSNSLLEFPKVNLNCYDFENLLGKKNLNNQGFLRSVNCSLNCTFGCK